MKYAKKHLSRNDQRSLRKKLSHDKRSVSDHKHRYEKYIDLVEYFEEQAFDYGF